MARYGDDMPEIRDWKWSGGGGRGNRAGCRADTAADNV